MRKLGAIGDKETENEVLLLEHDVPHCNFSEAVLSNLPKMPWVITEEVCIMLVLCCITYVLCLYNVVLVK